MAKKRDTGKNFESEIRRSLKSSKHIWWFRIQDTNDINRFVKQAVAEKQPADFFTVYRGRPIMLEAKTSRNLTSYPLYYGSKQDNECKECLDRGCDQVNNQIIIIEGIEEKKESIYKHDILRIWEDIMDENYFLGPYRGPMIALPMGGNFIFSDKINSIKELII